MADTDPAAVPPSAPSPARPKRRWVRGLLVVIAVLVVGLLVLVALAPTLLSTRPAMSLVLKQVNNRLNGRVTVQSVSLGWVTGTRLEGVQVFDDANVSIAQADRIVCPMPLWRAVTGRYPLGDTVIDGLSLDAKYDGQGRLNFAQLVKTTPPAPEPAGAKPAAGPAEPSKLPDVSGDIKLTNARGTVAQPGKPTVYLSGVAAEVKIPDVNSPVSDHLEAAVKVGDTGPVGHLVADGTASAVKASRVDPDAATIHQTADVTDLDLAAAKPFIPATAGVDTLAGLLAGHLALDVTDGKSATVDALLTGKQKVTIGGPILHGDTFTTNTFAAAVPKLTAAFPDGLGHWQTGRVQVGATQGSDPILLKIDQGQLTVVLDVVPQAVLNLGDGKAPGSAGHVVVKDHFDAAKIVGQLPHTARLGDGTALTGGTLDQLVDLTLTNDKGMVAVKTDLTGVAGNRTVDGKAEPVTIKPISLALNATDIGGGSPVNGLRDLGLQLTSGFANADFHGATVGDLTGTLTAQLQQLQAELGQLVDFKGTKLAGDVAVHVNNQGQLTQAPYAATVQVDATVTNLQYADAAGPRVAEPLVRLDVTGQLHGSEKAAVEQIKDLVVALKAGDATNPSVDVELSVPTATLGASPSADFQLTRLNALIEPLQQQFANVPAGEAGIVCGGGTLTGTASGHYDHDGVRLDPSKLSLAHLTVQKQLATGQRIAAISDDTINLSVAGTVATGPTTAVRLSDLSVADTAHLFDVHKGDGELSLTKANDAVSGRGQLAVMADLGALSDVAQSLARSTATPTPTAGRIKSGHGTGTLAFNAAASGHTDITGAFDVPDLDVASATGDTGPQAAKLTLKAASDDAAHTLTADEISFKAPFATATVTGLSVLLSAPSTVGELQKASLAIDVPDLKTLDELLAAFTVPPPTPPAGAPAPTPPLVVTAGTFALRADVSQTGGNLTVNVPTLTADHVAFTRGTASYQAKPISGHLAAVVGTADGKTVLAQLRGLKVTQLDLDAGPVAAVSMPDPIVVTDLSNPAASAAGGVKVVGDLGDLSALLAAYEAKPADAYPYRGQYTLTEAVAGGQAITLKGGLTVAKFQVMQGQQVQFAEDQLTTGNDLAFGGDFNSVVIHTLTVAMQSSGALNVSVTDGSVIDFGKARALHLPVEVQYDLAKLWPIVHPMLLTPGKPDAYADVKIAGAFKKSWLIGGSYPAGPFATAVKPLQVDADLAVASLEHSGITVKNLDVPVTVRDGRAVTLKPDGTAAPVATLNDGQADLSALTIDLTQTPMRLSTPAKKVVLAKVSINPLFTTSVLGKVVNNPVFVGAEQATGLIDLSLDRCDRLPLGDLVKSASPANDGSADIRFSMSSVHIGLPQLAEVSSALNSSSFETHVTDATVAVAKGVETQHIAFVSGPYTIGFDGSIRLSDDAFVPMTVTLPVAIALAKQGALNGSLKQYLPDTVPVALRGTAEHPQLALGDVVGKLLKDAQAKAVKGGLGNLLGGNKGGGGAAGGNGNPADDVGKALGGLFNKHK